MGHPELERSLENPVDQAIAECYVRARHYQEQLDLFSGPLEERQEMGNQFVGDLDAIYPLNGDTVWATGNALVPLTDEEGTVVGEDFAQTEGFGIHMGFNTISWQADNGVIEMKLMHQVLVGQNQTSQLQTVSQRNQFYKFFDLESSVFSIDELEGMLHKAPEISEGHQDQLEIIGSYSKQMEGMLRSTGFRRSSWRRQREMVGTLIDSATETTKIRDLRVMAEPEYAIAPISLANRRHFIPLYIGRQLLTGTCLGVDAPVMMQLRSKAIRRDADNPFLHQGFCLVVDPDEDVREQLRLSPTQVLYIPTHDQNFDAVLYND